jgi:hypothetical protein
MSWILQKFFHIKKNRHIIKPRKLNWTITKMSKVLKIKLFLNNFEFIRSHPMGELKMLKKSLRFSILVICSQFNLVF